MKQFLLILSFLLAASLYAAPRASAQTDVRRQIQKAAGEVKTMQCDFVQTKHLRLLNSKMVSKGRMYYQQSDHLRWEYTTPYTFTFILNGSKVLLRNTRRNDVIDVRQNKLFREIVRIMMNSVVGNALSDDKDFHTAIATTETEWVATLVPQRKDMKQMFQQIVLHFSREKLMVTCVELIEKKGDRTVIELKNVKTNATIAPDLFAVN